MGESEIIPGVQAKIESLLHEWRELDYFDGWSEEQLQVFRADLEANLNGRLLNTKIGDQLVVVSPSVLRGKLDYYSGAVTKVDSEHLVAEVTFTVDSPGRGGKYHLDTGLFENNDPNFSWLAPYDTDSTLQSSTEPNLLT